MTDQPIAHSALLKYAHEYATRMATDIAKFASGGVNPEGGYGSPAGVAATKSRSDAAPATATLGAAGTTAPESKFRFGNDSKSKLLYVHPVLADTAALALRLSDQDFCVYEGLRTADRQAKLVKQGYSKTLESKHLRQSDGYGHAVDLVPWIQGHPKWDWGGCYAIAVAMTRAATRLGVANKIRWGAVWDRTLADLAGDNVAMTRAVVDYANRHQGKDFLDGPHFEWIGN